MEACEPGINGLPNSLNFLFNFVPPQPFYLILCLLCTWFFPSSRLGNENKFVAISYNTKHSFSNRVLQ